MVARGSGGERGKDWEFEIGRCKLVYTGWINNKVLLYSTGNYIQYPVTNHNGKEYGRRIRDFFGSPEVKVANAGGLGSRCGQKI